MNIMFDTAIPFTNEDKERIRKNIQILQEKNLLYFENMKYIPTKTNTKLLEPKEIVNHLLNVYSVALKAKEYLNGTTVEGWLKLSKMLHKYYDIDKVEVEEKYMDMLNYLNSKNATEEEIVKYSRLYEECAIDLWAINLMDFPDQTKEVDETLVNKIILGLDEEQIYTIPKLFNKIYDDNMNPVSIETRSYEEILEKADLLVRYKWAFDEAKIKEMNLDTDISQLIVEKQLKGLCKILNYSLSTSLDGEKPGVFASIHYIQTDIELPIIENNPVAESFGRRPTREYDTKTYMKKDHSNIIILIITILVLVAIYFIFAFCVVYF